MESELFDAIEAKDLDKVKILIENGVNLEAKNEFDNTPLMYACFTEHCNIEIIKLLINSGANVNAKCEYGYTALFYSVYETNITKLLIDNGADVNTKDDEGNTALLNMFTNWNGEIEKEFETAKLLIEKDIDINAKNERGYTTLVYALNMNIKLANYLIEKGANTNGVSYALIHACEIENFETIKLIFDKGLDVDVNAKNEHGDTALCYACDNIEITKLLIDNGADVNIKNGHGKTALFYAYFGYEFNFEIIKLLLDKGADVNIKNEHGNTPLINACGKGYVNIEIAKLLLDKGADVNAKDNEGSTALHYAFDNNEITKLLLDKGADVNIKDNEGKTALFYAYGVNKQLLINKGADVNAKDNEGKTVLFYAYGQDKQLLINNGAIYEDNSESKEISKPLKVCKTLIDLNLNLPEDVTCFEEIGHCDVLVKDFVKKTDTILIKIGDNIKGYNRTEIIEYYNTKKTFYASEKLFPGEFEKLKNEKYLFFSSIETGENTFVLIPQTKEKFFS